MSSPPAGLGWTRIVLGGVLVVLVLALPAGIVGTFGNLAKKLRKD